MHAILTPVGSSGDVNPFVTIGRELRRRGHDVTVLAAEPFAGVVSNAGLAFVSTWSAEDYARTTSHPDLWHPSRGIGLVLQAVASGLRSAYAAIRQVHEPGRTIVVGHTLALVTRVFEEVHRVPAATVHLAPNVFRSDFRQPALAPARDISWWPRQVKRALWWGVDRVLIDPHITPALNRWRAELGLPPVSRVFNTWLHSPQRTIGLFPDWFADPQPDWPVQSRLSGFVLSDAPVAPALTDSESPARTRLTDDESRDSLDTFIAGGPAPNVFTAGSANRQARRFFSTAIEASARTGLRAVLVTGYREHLPTVLPGHVYHAGYAPFTALFPRAAAIVHHGGIGTCAQGFAAGVPQLVMPMGFDQPDNAWRVATLGAGETIAPSAFTPRRVSKALDRLLSSERILAACREWQQRIRAEDPVKHACDLLEETYDRHKRG